MGQSTNAILCYGIQLGEGEELNTDWSEEERELFDEDPDDLLKLRLLGPEKHRFVPMEQGVEGYKKWIAEWRERQKKLKAHGITFVQHCSSDYPMYTLAITESVEVAYRGYPERLSSMHITDNPDWDKRLLDALHELGINDVDRRAGWWLQSLWR